MKHDVKVTQIFRVERTIIIDVEADTIEEAIEDISSSEAPNFEDPRWRSGWELMSEEVDSA